MINPVVFPDSVLWACSYLRPMTRANGHDDARVADTYLGNSAEEIWVESDGGTQLSAVIYRSRLRINCYAEGDTSAAVSDLARDVITYMLAAAGEGDAKRVRLISGPFKIPDAKPRRYLLFEVDFRASNATLVIPGP